MSAKTKSIFQLFLFFFSCLTLLFLFDFFYFLNRPLVSTPISYEVKNGVTLRRLAFDLSRNDFISRPRYFMLLAYCYGVGRHLQVGEYNITPQTSVSKLLNNIAHGKVIQYQFTIVEGWTFQQLWEHLSAGEKLSQNSSIQKTILQKINAQEFSSPEGLFFPDTYYFTAQNGTVISLLTRAHQHMQSYLQNAWGIRSRNLPYKTPYEALIVASLIEKETAVNEERPLIAAVIVNRLRKRMHLQIDPTVIYGLGNNAIVPLTKNELKINTPYNTYLHYGLPPTPIAMPGRHSIDAAMHPASVDYYYFVARGDGRHEFSYTLQEQIDAIHRYQ